MHNGVFNIPLFCVGVSMLLFLTRSYQMSCTQIRQAKVSAYYCVWTKCERGTKGKPDYALYTFGNEKNLSIEVVGKQGVEQCAKYEKKYVYI